MARILNGAERSLIYIYFDRTNSSKKLQYCSKSDIIRQNYRFGFRRLRTRRTFLLQVKSIPIFSHLALFSTLIKWRNDGIVVLEGSNVCTFTKITLTFLKTVHPLSKSMSGRHSAKRPAGPITSVTRLKMDYMRLKKDPVPYIVAEPIPSNLLEWHYVVTGPEQSPYHGGLYHGKLVFPSEFPFKPPSIYMITPNGRFKVNSRLCLSM